jgi:hypothetical protein
LARSVGRLDWWNIKAEHTSYEWAAQIALYQVAPYGDRRADLRTAYNTANTIAAGRTQQTQPDEFRDMIATLMNYLGCDQRDPNEETPDAAALAMINREA